LDKDRIKKLVRELIIELGEDPTREGLRETPERIAEMYTEIFGGYDSDSELSVLNSIFTKSMKGKTWLNFLESKHADSR